MTDLSDIARRMAAAALAAVDPERLVRERLKDIHYDAVLSVGKAAAALARGVPDPPSRRLLIRPHTSPVLGDVADPAWEELSGGHPLPDRHSLAAGERLRDWLTEIGPGETLLALISGGSSACIELPADGLSLNDVIREHRQLLASGLPIGEVNAVRKRLSALKGGGALRLTRGRVVALLLSDVPGDDPGTIGSGLFEGAETILLGSIRTAMAGAAAEARLQGFSVTEGDLEGEASRAGRDLVERGRSVEGEAVALILGGETTVTLSPESGRGGRNGELALAAARDLSDGEMVLALATDGEDGTTGTAGAVVDGRTWNACPDPETALARHDSLTALEAVSGVLLRTGVTGTNVGDLAIYLRRMYLFTGMVATLRRHQRESGREVVSFAPRRLSTNALRPVENSS
jgi:hydroxypyruvate reductase